MSNKSYLTYRVPRGNFEMVPARVIENFDIELVGIFCKLVRISSGKTLRLDWLAKKIGVGDKKMRRAIVTLEESGYIVREAMRDEKGHISGWHYQLFSDPVAKDKRSCAGKKKDVSDNPNLTKTNQVGNGKVDIISNNDISYNNNTDNSIINNPVNNKDADMGSKEPAHKSDEEIYVEKMRERYPRIMKMEQPLTLEQAKKLKERFDSDLIAKVLEDMENWKPLLKNKVSAYKTLCNWCQRELDRS